MSKRMFLGVVCAATALNVGILIANLSSPSIAGVAGMDQQALTRDQDFVWAVQTIVQACKVNVDTAKINC